mmetsp:Transcript_51933/g.70843  ORF Transcript_51933/g.70843 Transcript_51933/m.70843 type:complete len:121 (+) Transcript_51933:674-1036(+)
MLPNSREADARFLGAKRKQQRRDSLIIISRYGVTLAELYYTFVPAWVSVKSVNAGILIMKVLLMAIRQLFEFFGGEHSILIDVKFREHFTQSVAIEPRGESRGKRHPLFEADLATVLYVE